MKRNIICACSCLLLFLGSFFAWQNLIKAVERIYPDAISFPLDETVYMRFTDLKSEQMSLSFTQNGMITKPGSEQPVSAQITFTDERFGERVSLSFVNGNYFSVADSVEENRWAVISEKTATELFFTTDAVGASLTIGEEEYTVCGVYQSDDSLLWQFSEDNRETVYVPYGALENWKALRCQTLLIDPDAAAFTAEASDRVYEWTGQLVDAETCTNYRDLRAVYRFLTGLFWFYAGSLVIVVLLFYAWRQGKKGYLRYIKTQRIPKTYWGASLGFVLAAGLIVWAVSFDAVLPSAMLPTENLLDISHYVTEWIGNIQEFHGSALFDEWRSYAFVSGKWIFLLAASTGLLYTVLFAVVMRIVRKISWLSKDESIE